MKFIPPLTGMAKLAQANAALERRVAELESLVAAMERVRKNDLRTLERKLEINSRATSPPSD